MKRMVVGLAAACLLGSLTVLAIEKTTDEKAAKKEPLQEITVTGKLAKQATGMYSVTTADGMVVKIKVPKAAKGEEAPAVTAEALNQLVGKQVKVAGQCVGKKDKTDKKVVLKDLTSIEEAAATEAAAATAAPEAAPVAAPVAAPEAAPAAPAAPAEE